MRRRIFVLSLVVLGGLSTPARAQEAVARAAVDSAAFLVGDAISVHVRISHPRGATVREAIGDSAGGFTVLGKTPFRGEGESATVGDVVVAKYDSGDAVLPPLRFLYSVPGDTALRTVATNELRLTIHTVAVDTSQEIHDLKSQIGIPLEWWEILLAVAAALLLVAAVWWGYRRWKRRRQKGEGAVPDAPIRPAHVIAFEELARLKEQKLWQQGLLKAYYSEVTEILRRYLENRYRVMALERTTDEILEDLRRLRMPGELSGKAETLLRRADLVKFAKHAPEVPEHEESVRTVYDFVERTKITEQAPAGGETKG
jgi:hypothetical protein